MLYPQVKFRYNLDRPPLYPHQLWGWRKEGSPILLRLKLLCGTTEDLDGPITDRSRTQGDNRVA
jgi:hypothetical protein